MELHTKHINLVKKCALILLAVIILTVVLLNVFHRNFNRDEFESLHAAWKILRGEKIYVDFFQNHNPLLFYLLAFVIKFSGTNIRTIFLGRLLIFLSFLITLMSTYYLGKLIFDKTVGFYATLILASTPLFVQKAIEIKPDIAMVACLMASTAFLFYYFKNLERALLFFSAISAGIAFLFLQKAVPYIFFINIILIYKVLRRKISYKAWLLFLSVLFLTLLPYFLYLLFSGSLLAYWKFPIRFTMIWLGNHSHNPAFIAYFFRWLSPVVIFFYVLGLLAFLKTEDQKIIGLLSVAVFFSIWVNALIAPQYYMPVLPFIALITAAVLRNGFKKNYTVFIALCLLLIPLIRNNYEIGVRSPGCKPTLKLVRYVLDHTDPNDYVYDGHASFNIYRKDLNFFWFVLDYKYGALFVYKKLHPYDYNIYDLIRTKKPRIISTHLLNVRDKRISRYYTRSPKYKNLYLLNEKAIEIQKLFHTWQLKHDKNILARITQEKTSFLNSNQLFEIGAYYFKKDDWSYAVTWLKKAYAQNPIYKEPLKMLATCYENLGARDKSQKYLANLKTLQKLHYGPFWFEDGGSLEAYTFSNDIKNTIKVNFFLHPPSTFWGCTIFLSFFKDGNFYFGRDIGLTHFKPAGELYEFKGKISTPPNLPQGTYKVYFTFRIPFRDYRYRIFKDGKLSNITKTFLGNLRIIRQ